MKDPMVGPIADALQAQQAALVRGDLAAIESSNAALAAALAALRDQPPAHADAVRRLQPALRHHAELLGRAFAANQRALQALTPPAATYGGATPAPSTGTHVVA